MSPFELGLEDAVIYVTEPHDYELVQLYRETWIDGKCVERVPQGLPMPESAVEATVRSLYDRDPPRSADLRTRLRRLARRAAEAQAERDRGVREAIAAGWTFDAVAEACELSPDAVSRIAPGR